MCNVPVNKEKVFLLCGDTALCQGHRLVSRTRAGLQVLVNAVCCTHDLLCARRSRVQCAVHTTYCVQGAHECSVLYTRPNMCKVLTSTVCCTHDLLCAGCSRVQCAVHTTYCVQGEFTVIDLHDCMEGLYL